MKREPRPGVAVILGILIGWAGGWAYWQPDPPAPVMAKAAKPIPKGLQLEVRPGQPRPKAARTVGQVRAKPKPTPDCVKPPEIVLDLVELKTGEVQVTTDAGEVVGGWSSPAIEFKPARPAWLAVAGYNQDREGSLLVGRDIGPFFVGASVAQDDGDLVGAVHFGGRFR